MFEPLKGDAWLHKNGTWFKLSWPTTSYYYKWVTQSGVKFEQKSTTMMKSEACFLPRNYLFEFDTEIWLQEEQFRFNKLESSRSIYRVELEIYSTIFEWSSILKCTPTNSLFGWEKTLNELTFFRQVQLQVFMTKLETTIKSPFAAQHQSVQCVFKTYDSLLVAKLVLHKIMRK